MLDDFGGVLAGDKPLQIQAQLSDEQLQKAVIYIMVGVFVATLLAGIIAKRI